MELEGSHCAAHGHNCGCATVYTSMDQTLDEIGFMKSACSAARYGNIEKLETILRKDPGVVHADGANGS